MDFQWIPAGGCDVFEIDGTRSFVPRFEISQFTITVVQYEQFCKESGYRTLAERTKRKQTFRDCESVSWALGEGYSLDVISAGELCIEDMKAFCEFYGVLLPTDQQWVSAKVRSWEAMPEKEAFERISKRDQSAPFMEGFGNEIVDTRVGELPRFIREQLEPAAGIRIPIEDHWLLKRIGPNHFLWHGWEKLVWRRAVPPGTVLEMTEFRVCRSV